MYTSTNIRFRTWKHANGQVEEFPDFEKPFRVSGKILGVPTFDGEAVDITYLLVMHKTRASIVINENNGRGIKKCGYDAKDIADYLKDCYAISALGFEYTVESLIFAILGGDM